MAKPNVFISHRWAYNEDYYKLVKKFNDYNFAHLDYSVPQHNPLDVNQTNKIKAALKEQVRQCNYFVIFANMAINNSDWCKYEVAVATEYSKPILSVRPYGYDGNIPLFIKNADTQNGPVGFSAPAIIRRICSALNYPLPDGI